MGLKDILFCITNPCLASNTILRQISVAADLASPPVGSTYEEFPGLPVSRAAELLKPNTVNNGGRLLGGGVQKEDWSLEDQKRILKGIRPKGYPVHRDI